MACCLLSRGILKRLLQDVNWGAATLNIRGESATMTLKILMPSPGQVSTRALCNARCGVAVIITSLKLM